MVAPARRWHLGRLRGRGVVRDPEESHRTATPLELFFDLTFVVAIARAAASLHHELAEGHVADGVAGYIPTFFAIWWAWMNYTWFASAHDANDVPHRLLTFLQMAGVLVLATGVTSALEHDDWLVVTIGYGIMRVPLAAAWLRVARDEPVVRTRCLRYATGVLVVQVLWFLRLALPVELGLLSFAVLALVELAVPVWAERAAPEPLFHAEHIEERYGLLTIIVLGESVLSAVSGFQAAVDEGGLTGDLLAIGVGGLLLAFSAWWVYFDHPGHLAPTPAVAFSWGYGHVVVFCSLAAVGAGLHVATEAATGHAPERTATWAVAVPTAAYLVGLVLLMRLTGTPLRSPRIVPKLLGVAALVGLGAFGSVTVAALGCAVVMVVLALLMVVSDDPAPAPA